MPGDSGADCAGAGHEPPHVGDAATQQHRHAQVARHHVWGPGEGDQACGEVGAGRMLEPTELAGNVANAITLGSARRQARVAHRGPTRERIDPVRSSAIEFGKNGFALAAAAREAGADVTIVCGPVSLATPPGVNASMSRAPPTCSMP